ncbi:siderophore-interacting protein [Thermomonospora cellulosilytica]|uniref:NADPH-dependent ferric siderophore reductase n=1 Tax=Thermomonospora cellulosilytica TaxID=1411118 RepID=A0A7W3R7L1_9ACTN|nr:siderophore-interacting protein [Thermomonospora cellulosilytica]MBA9002639.1 NADPH-dependent ferric siderophore reductase [Thermomonospora cellulosilytica]
MAYGHYSARVTRVDRVTPHMARVTLGGLEDFPGAGLDHRVKVFFPLPGEERPIYPTGDDWWERWQVEPVRAVFRTYTIRRHRPEAGEVDIDFVLHGDTGPGSRWAENAGPGDQVGLWGPRAEYAPPAHADWVLLAGDETALPAIGAILESLPPTTTARVLVEVASEAERQPFDLPGGVRLTWVRRDAGESLVTAVKETVFPAGRPYAWVAGESGTVKQIRRHLVNERGVDRRDIYFSGYWRRGVAQEV